MKSAANRHIIASALGAACHTEYQEYLGLLIKVNFSKSLNHHI